VWPYVIDAQDIINGSLIAPTSSGIYAWYRRLSVDDTTDENFIVSIEAIMSNAAWPAMSRGKGRIGPYESDTSLRPFSRALSVSKRGMCQEMAQDPQRRASIASLVLQASVLQPPLYVGRATRLYDRVNAHLRGETHLATFLGSDFEPSQLVLAYLETAGLPAETHHLLEAIVGTAAIPRYAGRTG
jgi:hypothetical protein